MKQWIIAAVCATGMLTLVGCSNNHLVHTTDGRVIEADNKPEINEDTGMIEFEDENGDNTQLPQSDVKEIKEL